MFEYFIPRSENVILDDSTEWICLHPMVKLFEIDKHLTEERFKYTVKLTLMGFNSQHFRGDKLIDAISWSDRYLKQVFPFTSAILNKGGDLIELEANPEKIEIILSGGGKSFKFYYNSSDFIRQLMFSKIVEPTIHNLENGEEMTIFQWVMKTLYDALPNNKKPYNYDTNFHPNENE